MNEVQRSGMSMMGLRATLMVGILVLLFASGCTVQQAATPAGPSSASNETPKSGGVLDMAYANVGEAPDLNPLIGGALARTSFLGRTYNLLVQFDPINNTQIVPDLAERWEVSPDGKTYTFYLHKGVKWHDGASFSAADVKYTMDRWQDPKDPTAKDLANKREALSSVEQVEAVDDSTLRLRLKYVSNSLLGKLADGTYLITPKHTEAQGVDLTKTAMGTGPFKLSDYQRGSVFRVVRNPNYFVKDRPYLDGINFYLLKDNSTRIAAFSTGQIKLLSYVYAPDVQQIDSVPQMVVSTKSALRNAHFAPNHEKPPFNDVRVRRAISLAIDRQAAMNVLVPGEGKLGTLFPPEVSTFSQEELQQLPGYRLDKTQDIAEAKRLLAEAGYPNGFKTTMISQTDKQDAVDAAIFLKDQVKKIGIDATLTPLGIADRTNVENLGTWDTQGSTGTGDLDPGSGFRYYGPDNYMRFKDATFENLRKQQDAIRDPAERKKVVRQMEQYWMDQALYPVLFWKTHSAVMYPEVRGYEIGVGLYNTHRFQDVWLAQ